MKYSIILLLIICCSCYTEKKAARQMDRAYSEHEIIAAGRCAWWYPVRIDTVRGVPIVIRDTTIIPGPTMYADCDSAWKAANAGRRPGSEPLPPGKVPVKCPDQLVIHDSVEYPIYINNESTARYRELELKAQNAEASERTKTGVIWVLGGLLLLETIAIIILIRRK